MVKCIFLFFTRYSVYYFVKMSKICVGDMRESDLCSENPYSVFVSVGWGA